MTATGWGRVFRFDQTIVQPASTDEIVWSGKKAPALFHGMGRSYGDVALNDGGRLIETTRLKRILDADWNTGAVRAEAGLTLNDLIQESMPHGWFPKVVPGTRYVTLGGAVANDVHGKNHHNTGSFGASIRALGLRRSDGQNLTLRRNENAELFALTLGGLGLTGFIEWVELQMQPISSSDMAVENFIFSSLTEFFEISTDSSDWPYTVAWIDCFASGASLGKGIFTRARHAESEGPLDAGKSEPSLTLPFQFPSFALNRISISTFNRLYAARRGATYEGTLPYQKFFFPLDGIANWNRMYGSRGFFQHQSLLPPDVAKTGLRELLETIENAGQGSFLAVLKRYGPEQSPGVMTFGGEGYSLALDFANKGERTRKLLRELDAIVVDHGGRNYPAKDATMSETTFKTGYPRWEELEAARDPALSSSFWRRVVPESIHTD